jgi:hypothetical protein
VALPFFSAPTRDAELLRGVAKTFGQTRSGTGNSHALGQHLPRIRTLDINLYCCPQARLRTLPGALSNRGDKRIQVEMSRQKCRIQIPLNGSDATATRVPPHREWFLRMGPTAMTILRQFRALGGNVTQGAARACNGAF